MKYGLYKKSNTIKKILGNPRAPRAQKNIVVWHDTRKGVVEWIKEYGTKQQKQMVLKGRAKK